MRFLILVLLALNLMACSQPKETATQLMTVQEETRTENLYFTAVIQPLKVSVIPAPAEGAIVEMPYQYGETVQSGATIFQLASTKFIADYKTALMQYVKAKSDFNTSQMQLTEGEFLHKNQLISDDDFKMKRANFYASQLALLQAKDALDSLLQQLNLKKDDLHRLSINDIDKITAAIHNNVEAQTILIKTPTAGILLSPPKNEDGEKKLGKGDLIKQGEVLALMGDMSGVRVAIKVNELSINQLHLGQAVSITGAAFSQFTLHGKIARIDRQAEASNSGLPLFPVEVIVPKLSPQEQEAIRVGMSARVAVLTSESPTLTIPLSAVFQMDGKAYVSRFNPNTKQVENIAITPGKTTLDSITVLGGLNPGDKIVSTHSA